MAGLMDEYPMPGLDIDPRELEKAKYLALMRMGLGMASKEPLARAVQGGINTYFAGDEAARRNADQKMQEAQVKMKYAASMDAAKRQQELRGQLGGIFTDGPQNDQVGAGGPTPANAMLAYPSLMQKYLRASEVYMRSGDMENAKKAADVAHQIQGKFNTTPQRVMANGKPVLLMINDNGNIVEMPYGAPPEIGKVNPGDFQPGSVAEFAQGGNYGSLVPLDKTPRTTVNVSNQTRLESAESQHKGIANVKYYEQVKTSADQARKENSILTVLSKNPLETGAGVPLTGAAANWLTWAGVDNKKVAALAKNSAEFQANAMDLVLTKQLAQKGPQTESDARRLEQTVASAANPTAANRAIIAFAKAQNDRTIQQHKFLEDWWSSKGTYEGADSAWLNGPGGQSLWEDKALRAIESASRPVNPAMEDLVNKYKSR